MLDFSRVSCRAYLRHKQQQCRRQDKAAPLLLLLLVLLLLLLCGKEHEGPLLLLQGPRQGQVRILCDRHGGSLGQVT